MVDATTPPLITDCGTKCHNGNQSYVTTHSKDPRETRKRVNEKGRERPVSFADIPFSSLITRSRTHRGKTRELAHELANAFPREKHLLLVQERVRRFRKEWRQRKYVRKVFGERRHHHRISRSSVTNFEVRRFRVYVAGQQHSKRKSRKFSKTKLARHSPVSRVNVANTRHKCAVTVPDLDRIRSSSSTLTEDNSSHQIADLSQIHWAMAYQNVYHIPYRI